jgi:hypothetical protein
VRLLHADEGKASSPAQSKFTRTHGRYQDYHEVHEMRRQSLADGGSFIAECGWEGSIIMARGMVYLVHCACGMGIGYRRRADLFLSLVVKGERLDSG